MGSTSSSLPFKRKRKIQQDIKIKRRGEATLHRPLKTTTRGKNTVKIQKKLIESLSQRESNVASRRRSIRHADTCQKRPSARGRNHGDEKRGVTITLCGCATRRTK